MTAPTLAEPACPGPPGSTDRSTSPAVPLASGARAVRRAFGDIPRATWDALAAANPWSTPFSSWGFHRAWWDAFGDNAHDETLVVLDATEAVIGIAPLMHRHEVEPGDAATRTRMRGIPDVELTPVPPTATAMFFGASYHADYATLLCARADLPAVAGAVATYLADPGQAEWDVIDLRRLRCGDPAAEALAGALGAMEIEQGWTLNVEREDVCPVVTLPADPDIDAYLATLGKKERHEIRRKVRRAEATGPIALDASSDPLADLDAFIDLHQKRWGADGLFPSTPGGEQSRVFFRRLFEERGGGGPV